MVATSGGALRDLGELVTAGRRQLRQDAHRGVVRAHRHAWEEINYFNVSLLSLDRHGVGWVWHDPVE